MTELLFIFPLIEEFRNLDLDIAEVALSSDSFPLLLVRIGRLLRAWRAALEATVPVMRYKPFALMSLRGSMRVDVVNMWEISLEFFFCQRDHIIYIEQPFPPQIQIWRIRDQLEPLELAMICERGLVTVRGLRLLEHGLSVLNMWVRLRQRQYRQWRG